MEISAAINFLFSDLFLGLFFLVLSVMQFGLWLLLLARRNNAYWALGGLIISASLSTVAFQGILIQWFRVILFLFGIFLLSHISWNLYCNLAGTKK